MVDMCIILNDNQKAIDYLEERVLVKYGIAFLTRPFLKPLHDEPRYQALMEKIGLPILK